MRRSVVAIALGMASVSELSAQGNTDIFVAPLAVRNGVLAVGTPVNATARAGYDNQPAFLRDGSGFLFTSIRDDAQADIYRYDLRTRAVTRVTTTPESEYSATPLADGRSFSSVRVEPDSTQRLWRFAIDGSAAPSIILRDVKPVGYHAWVDDTTLAMFVLGEPATLQVASLGTGKASTYDRDIGRGLQPVPGARGATYIERAGDTLYVTELTFLGGGAGSGTYAQRRLARSMAGVQDIAYTPGGDLLAARGDTIYRWSRTCTTNDGWEPIGDMAGARVRNITRLALSPDGKWIAFVAEPM